MSNGLDCTVSLIRAIDEKMCNRSERSLSCLLWSFAGGLLIVDLLPLLYHCIFGQVETLFNRDVAH